MGAGAKPKGTFLNSNFLNGTTKVDFFGVSGKGAIWWYPEVQSNEE